MTTMKKIIVICVLLTVFSLTACEGNSGDTNDINSANSIEKGEEPKGGILTYGETSSFSGVLDWAHYENFNDSIALNIFSPDSLFKTGEDLRPEPNLAKKWEWSDDKKTVTFFIEENVKWHNGEKLTAEDFEFAWEVMAHADYTGPRVSNVNIIQGFNDYHTGEADSLSGVNIIDEYTLEVTFNEAYPNAIEQLWPYPMPKAYLEHLEVGELEDADEIRQKPVGLGAYRVTQIIPGELIEFEAFDDYWKGKPNLDGVNYRIVDGAQAAELLTQGEIDIIKLEASQAVTLKDDERVILEEVEALSYAYLGFKLGHWDVEKRQNVMDNEKFQSKQLRQAFAYALDRQGMIDSFSEGYGTVINAPESVISWAYPDEGMLNQYEYDPEQAMALLKEAGYDDITGDGFVETPEGEEFTVNLTVMDSPSNIAEPRAQYIIQNLQDVGINAQLHDGQLYDYNLFYDLVQGDDPDIDLFLGAWSLTSDPDPTGLWKSDDLWNYTRWVNKESDKLIEKGLSMEAFDDEYRREVYQEWHQLVNEELPIIPLSSPVNIYGMSHSTGGVTPDLADAVTDAHLWYKRQ
jgi:peptide/nickel transport system substrate-binding protein